MFFKFSVLQLKQIIFYNDHWYMPKVCPFLQLQWAWLMYMDDGKFSLGHSITSAFTKNGLRGESQVGCNCDCVYY